MPTDNVIPFFRPTNDADADAITIEMWPDEAKALLPMSLTGWTVLLRQQAEHALFAAAIVAGDMATARAIVAPDAGGLHDTHIFDRVEHLVSFADALKQLADAALARLLRAGAEATA